MDEVNKKWVMEAMGWFGYVFENYFLFKKLRIIR